MNDHLSATKLNDLVDGLLPAAEVASARAHVDACPVCREEYARLSEVVQQLRALPRSADTPEVAWSGIGRRIGSAGTSLPGTTDDVPAEVVPLRRRGRTPRRLTFSIPQLAAAAVVVSFVSATTVWLALGPGGSSPVGIASDAPDGAYEIRTASAETAGKVAEYDAAIADLEDILGRGRVLLSPETLATLENSLQTIDDAIGEVREALERDPASELLLRMLVTQQRTKLQVLRQAATSLYFRS